MKPMDPRSTLQTFDAYLFERRLELEAVVIGGAALALLGVVSRPTKDCDVLAPPLTSALRVAAREFAEATRAQGLELDDEWLNNGPSQLASVLPTGWKSRLQPLFTGRAIRLQTLDRLDLLRSKIFALCDRGLDLADCVALHPSEQEVSAIREWLEYQDANPDWPAHVAAVLRDLDSRLDRGVDHGF
jgi:hypothetical protein